MGKGVWRGVFIFGAVLGCAAILVAAPKLPEYANDLGPSTIDVPGYPREMQQNYKLFEKKCSGCHTAARAVNSEFVESKQWTHYVQRMYMRPPCCDFCPIISHADAKAIWKFLVYDSQVRKTGPRAEEWAHFRLTLLKQYQSEYPKRYEQRYGRKDSKSKEIP